ncbi:MAG: hypothetical protein RQ866_07340, partial [Bacteroidales bacterium]|nr:hypothetical protein [Bacteroidales bacterium]
MTSPIRKHIATFASYRLHDIVKGTSILKTLHFLRKSQYWPEEKMQEYRSEKLKKLVSYAYEKVPYYHDLFNSEHLKPSDIRSIDDIWKIPILTKEQARKANKAILSKDLSSMRVKRGKTGGTTGPPLTIYSGTQARSFVWGAFLRWYDWMDIHPGNYTVTFWGTPTVMSINHIKRIKQKSAYWLLNNKIENAFNLNEKTIPALIANINHRKPSFVRGYLSAMLQIGNFAETNNIPLFAPKAISTTTETLLPHLRERLNSTWGAPLFDQYGCGECESIAFECDAHEGLHINEEHVIIEAVDDNGITG